MLILLLARQRALAAAMVASFSALNSMVVSVLMRGVKRRHQGSTYGRAYKRPKASSYPRLGATSWWAF
jgi:hypothetical protein